MQTLAITRSVSLLRSIYPGKKTESLSFCSKMNKPGIWCLQRTATHYLSFSKGQLGVSDGLGQTWLKSFGLAPTSRTDGETQLSLPWS